MKINVDKRKLNNLINKFDRWKEEYSQLLQQYELKLQRSRDKQAMLNSEQVSWYYYDFFPIFLWKQSNEQIKEITRLIDFISGEKSYTIQ